MPYTTTRRVLFNPTSIPSLRTKKPHTRDIYNATSLLRVGLGKGTVNAGWKFARGSVRRESTQIGEDATGHIKANANEGILFFDNVFPLKLRFLLHLPLRGGRNLSDMMWRYNNTALSRYDPLNLVKRAIPESIPLKVTEILPRLKDGGAFVKFQHEGGVTAQEIESRLATYLRENPIKPWYNPFSRIRAKLVVGKPWLEDLYRFPSRRIKIEFVPATSGKEAAELSQETIYSLFRRYGKLSEITSQPSDSKVLPKYAYVDFSKMRQSIMAKNCLHGFKVLEEEGGGAAATKLRLSFEQKIKAHLIRDWIVNHPRVVIPAVAALLATVTVAVFDPIRTFFIKAKIDHSFQLNENKIYKWFKSQATDILTFRKPKEQDVSLGAIWDDRKEIIDQIQTWLMETADTFIVIQGPRGSGKRELILDQALKGRKNTLIIDCKPIQEARGDSSTIAAAASEVGYRPIFSWMNSISSLVDLAAQGTIGVKSGFSETLDAQLGKIWQNTKVAMKQVALAHRDDDDKDANLSDDDWLEAHPEYRPVVVIDNFLHKSEDSSLIYDKLSEWAASLTTTNIAHVIFLTNDISYSKSLSKALPDRVFRQIALGDISPEVAKRFVITHLDSDTSSKKKGHEAENDEKALTPSQRREDLMELDGCIDVLGGRLTDLEFLARRLKTGQSPNRAVTEIIEQSASEILKMYLLTTSSSPSSGSSEGKKWTPEQAWYLVSNLANSEALKYNEVLLSPTFTSSLTASASNPESVLEALSAAELITIKTYKGRPQKIVAGRPVYQAAFRQLTQDKVLRSRLDLSVLKELSKVEEKAIEKVEAELAVLGALPKQPAEVGPRVQFLLAKLAGSQVKVEGWEKEMGVLKKVLGEEF
ncbi:hypothetical protein HYFRA_00003861 [Hymenoscyphus fraxineus]|uniref:Mitochondrial escape protein 2 n=1 Tax=Hymenoscyphus fraxineus TaxID=746836 RepID=A0A9N9L2F0_9HELO|nr:hypothetical protein HYFRA_00003861 [Hymenoscyphus fraxineus]